MATCQNLIDQTLRHLHGGHREAKNKLAQPIDTDDTTLTFTYDSDAITEGTSLAIGLENFYVWEANPQNKTCVAERAQNGSTAAAHVAGEIVVINPRFSQFDAFDALNADLRSLSGDGLYRMRTTTVTTTGTAHAYNLTATDIDDVYDVRIDTVGPENYYPRIRGWEYRTGLPTADFTDGRALLLDYELDAGRTLTIWYKAAFGQFATVADTTTSIGLPDTAIDIPPLGAAARLLASHEAKRTQLEAQPETRRHNEVRVGDATRAAQTFLGLREQRLGVERSRLNSLYPVFTTR